MLPIHAADAFLRSGPISRLDPRGLPDQAADAIVRAVASGALRPGERILEQRLAAALGISRVPLREGIRILAAQGLVDIAPHRGRRIASFSDDKIRQLRDVRVALEQLAAGAACHAHAAEPRALDPVRAALARIGEMADRRDRLAVIRCDLEFHHALWRVAGNDMLMRLWEAISRHILIIFALETETETDFEGIFRQHAQMLAVLESGDAGAVDREVRLHIKQFRYGYAGADDRSTKPRRTL